MTKTKILLVEDDKSLREIYGVRLYSEGYDIISAGDGEEALALAIKERPPLIISDVMMPKISGFDMLDILRSTSETKEIKVIMMTALSSEDQRARGESLGADRYLVKSQVGIEDVVRAVHEVLGDAPVAGSVAPQAAPSMFATPSAPATPSPVAPTPVAPAPTPAAPAPVTPAAPAALPQPTAPFSTDRPPTLGDRVIHPIESTEPPKDFGAMMNAELSSSAPAAAPAPQPEVAPAAAPIVAPPVPQAAPSAVVVNPVAAPVAPVLPATPMPESPTTSGLVFEETPPAAVPSTPPTPPTPGV